MAPRRWAISSVTSRWSAPGLCRHLSSLQGEFHQRRRCGTPVFPSCPHFLHSHDYLYIENQLLRRQAQSLLHPQCPPDFCPALLWTRGPHLSPACLQPVVGFCGSGIKYYCYPILKSFDIQLEKQGCEVGSEKSTNPGSTYLRSVSFSVIICPYSFALYLSGAPSLLELM